MNTFFSLRRKVFLALFAVVGLAISLGALGLALWEYRAAETRALPSLETLASSIFVNAETALQFNVPEDASHTLASLGQGGQIVSARIYSSFRGLEPVLFAEYVHPSIPSFFAPSPRSDGYWVFKDHALLVRSRELSPNLKASLELEIPLATYRKGLLDSLVLLGLLLALLLLVGALLGFLLQRAITGPLLRLADTAVQVNRTGNYRLRASVESPDEVGRLATAFNQMLLGMEQRDCKLAEQAAFQQAILDHQELSIITTQLDGTIQFFNAGAQAMLGYDAKDLLGRQSPLLMHDPEELASRALELTRKLGREVKPGFELFRTLASMEPVPSEWTYIRKDGSRVPVLLVVSALRAPSGEVFGLCGIATDLSGRKLLEERLLRTQRLESIGRLASGLAHDLNNVLAPILLSADFLRLELPQGKAGEFLELISSNARRGAAIIRQLLTFSRGVEGPKVSLRLEGLVKEMLRIMHATFPKNIAVHASLAPDTGRVLGDATHLHQVLMNLCVNARDAMPSGGSLSLGLRRLELDAASASVIHEARGGTFVVLSVEDTGCGIPEENLGKIFDPFFTTKGPGSGTGLGLSTVLGIVKSHQGFIQLQSKVGAGTCFRVFFPACEEPEALPFAAPQEALPKGKGQLILLVDDEEDVRRSTLSILRRNGYTVEDFGVATAALDWFYAHPGKAQAVVTDMLMPGMDGLTFVRALRKSDPLLPIIAISGNFPEPSSNEDPARPQAVLSKPFSISELLQTMERVVKRD